MNSYSDLEIIKEHRYLDFNFLSLIFLFLFIINITLELLNIHYPVGLLYYPVLLIANSGLCQKNINWSKFVYLFLPFLFTSFFYLFIKLFPNIGYDSIYILVYHSQLSVTLFVSAFYIFSDIKDWKSPIDNRKAVVIISLLSFNVIISFLLFLEVASVIFGFSLFENPLFIVISISFINIFIIIYSLRLRKSKVLPDELILSGVQLKSNNISESDQEKYKEILDYLFEERKVYLKYDITLDYLAKESGIPKNNLSLYLNTYLNTSFYEKVAKHRIEHAISAIGELNNNLNLQEIAYSSGFNSVSTFNKYFKKITGTTVSDYLKTK